MSHITIRRKGGFNDLARSYIILVDGVAEGVVKHGDAVSISVSPGRHSLQLKIDWCTSPELHIDVPAGQTSMFDCGNNAGLWAALLYTTIWRAKYLWLRPAPSPGGHAHN